MRMSLQRLKFTGGLLALLLVVAVLTWPVGRALAQAGEPAVKAATAETPAPIAAPEKEEPHGLLDPNPGEAFFTVLVFVGLLVILRFTAWKPILSALKGREEAIRESIEAAGKAKAQAERTTHELEARISEAQKQAASQIVQAKADATKVADGIKKQAEVEVTQLKDRTVRDIEAAKQQALAEINAHAAELGIAIARKILQRQITVDDQGRLVDEALTQLGKNN